MKKGCGFAVLLLTCWAGATCCAQTMPHTPVNDSLLAQGWTYVHSFDSVFDLKVHGYGDTVIFDMIQHDSEQYSSSRWWVSLDGGKTIDHEWQPYYRDNSGGTARAIGEYGQLFAHDPIAIGVPPDASTKSRADTIYITTDLGRTIRTWTIDTAGFRFPIVKSWLDPTDNSNIYIEYGQVPQNHTQLYYSYYLYSTDTGKSWAHIPNLPEPVYGLGTIRQSLMDVRKHGLWYTMATDGDESVISWYKHDSTNDFVPAEPFNYSLNGSEQAGIGYPGELRRPWGPDYFRYFSRGVETWSEDWRNPHTIKDWADSLVPGMPDTMLAQDGYGFGIPGAGYQYSPANPACILVPIWYATDTPVRAKSWIFFSSTAGSPFTLVWHQEWTDTPDFEPSFFIDCRNPYSIWAITSTGWNNFYAKPLGTFSVFKIEMPHGNSRVSYLPATDSAPKVDLSPSKVEIAQVTSAAGVEIFDILGRRIFFASLSQVGVEPRTLTFSKALPPGAYFVTFLSESGAVIKTVPAVVR